MSLAASGCALLAQAARFLAAGGLATAVHYALLAGLVELARLPPTPATCLGYAVAAALNYWLRRRFVFRSRAPHRRALPRYLVVLGAGFGLNGGVMALGAGALGLPYGAVQVAATGLVTAWNFAAHRLWTFGGGAAAETNGCPTSETAFNGGHTAGPQVLNSGRFPDTEGPLSPIQ